MVTKIVTMFIVKMFFFDLFYKYLELNHIIL